jgi:Dolichyl-phosphate-mannose-protein mannosyltransferase
LFAARSYASLTPQAAAMLIVARRFSAKGAGQGLRTVLQSTVKVIALGKETSAATRTIDALAIAILVVMAAIAAASFRDYGLGWDDFTESQYGHLLVSLYSSGFTDKRALSFVNLYMYGGGFDLLGALAAKVSPFGLFATRRLLGAAVGIVGLFVTWRLGRRVGGPLAGLLSLILLATCPLYYGHMFINCKDAPFATTMMIALLGIVRALEEYPRARPTTIALCGIGVGLAIGTRVLGGFAVLDALLATLLVLALRSRMIGLRPAAAECRAFVLPFLPAAILAILVMGLVWPWSVASPLNLFRAVHYFSHDFERPWRELFDGRLIPIVDMPQAYVPTLIAVQLPELMLALGLCGTIGALVGICRGDGSALVSRRPALLVILLAAILPVLMTVLDRPYLYNGFRHLLFIVPPFAVLGGLAGAWIALRLERFGRIAMAGGAAVLIAGTASPIVDMVRLHPYEYTDFNHLVGGVKGARPLYMVDYWGLSLTQASRRLLRYITAHKETPPNGKWTVAVCGPHPPVSVALGPAFNLTWSSHGADFAMMLGEFYCAKLNAPLLFQIVRDGVVYARVYDIHGRSISSLLTLPGI